MPLRWHGARRWPGCKDKEGQPPLEAPPLLELPLLGYRNEACFRLHLGSNHRTSPNGAYLSLRLQRPEDYRRLQEVSPVLGISPPTHGPRDRRPWHYQCSHQALPRERCRLISQDHPSLPHLPSKLHSHRASLLPLMSSRRSHPRGQQEEDCWLDLLQMDPLLPLTLSTRTVEDNRPGDGASQAN